MKHPFLFFCLVANNLYGQIAVSVYTGGEVIESKSTHLGYESSSEPRLSYLLGGNVELGVLPWLGFNYSFEQSPKTTRDWRAGANIQRPALPGYDYKLRRHVIQMRMYFWPNLDIGCGLSQNVLWHPVLRDSGAKLENAKSFGPTVSLRARYKNFLLEPNYYYGLNKYEVGSWETHRVQTISVKVGYRYVFPPFRKREKVRCPKF